MRVCIQRPLGGGPATAKPSYCTNERGWLLPPQVTGRSGRPSPRLAERRCCGLIGTVRPSAVHTDCTKPPPTRPNNLALNKANLQGSAGRRRRPGLDTRGGRAAVDRSRAAMDRLKDVLSLTEAVFDGTASDSRGTRQRLGVGAIACRVGRRLRCRMLPPSLLEAVLPVPLAVRSRQPTILRRHWLGQHLLQLPDVIPVREPLGKAALL